MYLGALGAAGTVVAGRYEDRDATDTGFHEFDVHALHVGRIHTGLEVSVTGKGMVQVGGTSGVCGVGWGGGGVSVGG